jgi:hypothetical protein
MLLDVSITQPVRASDSGAEQLSHGVRVELVVDGDESRATTLDRFSVSNRDFAAYLGQGVSVKGDVVSLFGREELIGGNDLHGVPRENGSEEVSLGDSGEGQINDGVVLHAESLCVVSGSPKPSSDLYDSPFQERGLIDGLNGPERSHASGSDDAAFGLERIRKVYSRSYFVDVVKDAIRSFQKLTFVETQFVSNGRGFRVRQSLSPERDTQFAKSGEILNDLLGISLNETVESELKGVLVRVGKYLQSIFNASSHENLMQRSLVLVKDFLPHTSIVFLSERQAVA